jgi:hypothetical protein
MAVTVVDAFEEVDVEQGDADRMAAAGADRRW